MLRAEPAPPGGVVLSRNGARKTRVPNVRLGQGVLEAFNEIITLIGVPADGAGRGREESILTDVLANRFPSALRDTLATQGVFISTAGGTYSERTTIDEIGSLLWTHVKLTLELPWLAPGFEYNDIDHLALKRQASRMVIKWAVDYLCALSDGRDFGNHFGNNESAKRFQSFASNVALTPSGWGNVGHALRMLTETTLNYAGLDSFTILGPYGTTLTNAVNQAEGAGQLDGLVGSTVVGTYNNTRVIGTAAMNTAGRRMRPVAFSGVVRPMSEYGITLFVPSKVKDGELINMADTLFTPTTIPATEISQSLWKSVQEYLNIFSKRTVNLDDVTIGEAIGARLFTSEDVNTFNAVNGTDLDASSHLRKINVITEGFPGGISVVVPATVMTYAMIIMGKMNLILIMGKVRDVVNDYMAKPGVAMSALLATAIRPIPVTDAIIAGIGRAEHQDVRFLPASLNRPVESVAKGRAPFFYEGLLPGLAKNAEADEMRMRFATAVFGDETTHATPLGIPASNDVSTLGTGNAFLNQYTRSMIAPVNVYH